MTKNPISSTNEYFNRKSFSDCIVGVEDQHLFRTYCIGINIKEKEIYSVKMVYLDLYGYVLLRLTIDHLL